MSYVFLNSCNLDESYRLLKWEVESSTIGVFSSIRRDPYNHNVEIYFLFHKNPTVYNKTQY